MKAFSGRILTLDDFSGWNLEVGEAFCLAGFCKLVCICLYSFRKSKVSLSRISDRFSQSEFTRPLGFSSMFIPAAMLSIRKCIYIYLYLYLP